MATTQCLVHVYAVLYSNQVKHVYLLKYLQHFNGESIQTPFFQLFGIYRILLLSYVSKPPEQPNNEKPFGRLFPHFSGLNFPSRVTSNADKTASFEAVKGEWAQFRAEANYADLASKISSSYLSQLLSDCPILIQYFKFQLLQPKAVSGYNWLAMKRGLSDCRRKE